MVEELASIFEELPETGARAGHRSGSPVDAGPLSLSDPLPGESPTPALGVAEQVREFMPLNRRRLRGNPALTPAEIERWCELREQLEYAFGSASPPLGGSGRRALRVPTDLKVRVCGESDAVSSLRDLSENGAFIEITPAPAPATTLTLEIEPTGGGPLLCIGACVKWRREIGNMDGPAGIGVEFTAVEDSDFPILEGLVDRSLAAAGTTNA